MGLGLSIVMLAVGAILVWAVDYEVSGIDLRVAGYILLAVGALGALWALLVARGGPRDETVVP